jgi:hypothetical protein
MLCWILIVEQAFRREAANELGIAFDLLCWKFGETGHKISEAVYDMLAEAGSMMEMPPSQWTKLKTLVRDSE